jgi:hypothetical protein
MSEQQPADPQRALSIRKCPAGNDSVTEITSPKTPTHEDDPWRCATQLLKPLGSIAGNFTTAIRTLLSYHERDMTTLSVGAQTHLLRILRNQTVKATYYFATKAYRAQALSIGRKIQPRDFLNLYTPYEHAVLLTFCYLFRTLSKKSNKEEWEYIQAPLYEALEIGACIGRLVPQVGLATGLLSRGIRYLAFAPFLVASPKDFQQYRRHLKSKDLPFDSDKEQEIWGCTSIHTAALLMEHIGYNRSLVGQFVACAQRDSATAADTRYGIPFRVAETLMDAFVESGQIPETLPEWVGVRLTFDKEKCSSLLAELERVVVSGDRIEWLNKGSSSVTPATTPELFDDLPATDSTDQPTDA